MFVWDAKTLVRTLDKMNNSIPIIKIFLFPCTERTERFFLPILPTFLFLPAHENARYAKMVSDCDSVNSVLYINISRDYYSGEKKKKKNGKNL